MQGNHKELKILLQKCLASSRFNQKLSLRKENIDFIEISLRKISAVRFAEKALDTHDASTSRAMSGHVLMSWPHVLLNFCHLIFIGPLLCGHVSLHD